MQELLQCLSPSSFSNLSVPEKQRARLQWQQSIEFMHESNNLSCDSLISPPISLQNPQPDQYPIHEGGCTLSTFKYKKERTLKKRKTGKSSMVDCDDEEGMLKRRKAEGSPENSTEKQDFIHVRARRGMATDSHSLAERVRRERISERMKYLEGLVPGCEKITGKAGMLDEIINYVQSLQRQVEFLSMKLATANCWVDFDIDSVFPKEVNFACNPSTNIHRVGLSPHEMAEPYLHANAMHQMAACCGLNMNVNVSELELALRQGLVSHVPIPVPDTFFGESFEVDNCSWDANSESICGVDFHHGKVTIPAHQSLTGN